MARYKDMIPYIVFGVLTTLVNMVAYWLLAHCIWIDLCIQKKGGHAAACFYDIFQRIGLCWHMAD